MRNKRWIVCIDWVCGSTEDTAEVRVCATSAADAKARALWRWWRKTDGSEVGVQRVFVLTKKTIGRLCY